MSDGTRAGTVRISDVSPDPPFVNVHGKLLFTTRETPTATGRGERTTVWLSDGTPDGTRPGWASSTQVRTATSGRSPSSTGRCSSSFVVPDKVSSSGSCRWIDADPGAATTAIPVRWSDAWTAVACGARAWRARPARGKTCRVPSVPGSRGHVAPLNGQIGRGPVRAVRGESPAPSARGNGRCGRRDSPGSRTRCPLAASAHCGAGWPRPGRRPSTHGDRVADHGGAPRAATMASSITGRERCGIVAGAGDCSERLGAIPVAAELPLAVRL